MLHPTREQYLDVVKALLDDGYEMCVDLTAVDYLAHPGRAAARRRRAPSASRSSSTCSSHRATGRALRLRVQVPADDPTLPTLFDLYPGTEAHGARGLRHVRHRASTATPTSPAS